MAAKPHTVLVIDDDPFLLGSVIETLTREGFKVWQAHNGKEGFEQAVKRKPDLILTDNVMPVMSGVEMIAGIRNQPWGKRLPVIIMTNMYTADMLNQSLQAGATDYIMKSDISLAKIVELVRNKLKD